MKTFRVNVACGNVNIDVYVSAETPEEAIKLASKCAAGCEPSSVDVVELGPGGEAAFKRVEVEGRRELASEARGRS